MYPPIDRFRMNTIFQRGTPNLYETLGVRRPRRFDEFASLLEPLLRQQLSAGDVEQQLRQAHAAREGDLFAHQMLQERLRSQRPMNVVYQPPPRETPEYLIEREKLAAQKELQESKLQAGLAKESADLALALRKQALEEWKARNPTGQIVTDRDGRILLVHPLTGESIDTGLKSNQLSDIEKARLDLAGKKEMAQFQEMLRRERIPIEAQARRETQIALAQEQERLRRTRPPSPLDVSREINNRALRVAIEHPEWARYIQIDPVTGNFLGIKPPSTGLFGLGSPDPEVYDKIRQAIYGETTAPTQTPPKPDELVDVINPQGKPVRIRKSQLDQALKQGYKRRK